MSRLNQLPLWRDASALLLHVEQCVRRFPRYHKYTIGTDLRRQSQGVCRLVIRAVNESQHKLQQVMRLSRAIDDLKMLIQLAKEIKAFARFADFQIAAQFAVAIGKQVGQWCKHL